ncbi:MAG: hypothetical protein KDI31_00660, partial [Pseudomonadales bacterium]|nr:hypothetical protein [Pseudomonadales bacterium]
MRSDFHNYLGSLQDLEPSNRDPTAPVVAYFDLDRTLISGYSITALALEKMWSGLSPRRMLIHIGIF